MKLEIILEKEENGTYSVHCPALKGCHSQGDNREEALKNIQEAIQLYLELANEKAKTEAILQPESTIAEIAVWQKKRLLPVSGKQMVKVFRKIGFQLNRQKGSHIIMSKENDILVIPNHKTIAKGTERELIKDAGLTVEEFNKLLME